MDTLSQDIVQQGQRIARSLGVKLMVVGVLALLMTIPALFVSQLVEDRSSRAAEVSRSVGSVSGGQQTFLGPVLAIPYTSAVTASQAAWTRGSTSSFRSMAKRTLQPVRKCDTAPCFG